MEDMLANHVAVVTGAAGGLGATTVRCLVDHGASVVLIDLDADRVQAVADEVAAAGGEVLPIGCDITDEAAVAGAAARTAERFGRCDVLVNNAGVVRFVSLADTDMGEWNRVMDINLGGAFLCSKYFGELMRRNSYGSIVNIGSTAGGTVPEFEGGSYSSSKAGLEILARQIAIEWGPVGVRANTVCPGMMRAPLSTAFYADPAVLAVRESMVALNRIADTREIAEVVAFLASPRAGFVTGQSIDVDGGMSQMVTKLLPRPAAPKAAASSHATT